MPASMASRPLEALTEEEFHRQFNTNVLGLLLTTQAAVAHFPAEGGSVINISSLVTRINAADGRGLQWHEGRG